MKINLVQYKVVDAEDHLQKYRYVKLIMSQLIEFEKGEKDRVSILTEELDVIKFTKSNGEIQAFCVPNHIQEEIDWTLNIFKKQLEDMKCENNRLKKDISFLTKGRNLWERLKYLFTNKFY